MSIITLAEVKTILGIDNIYVNKESVTMDTVNYKRLTYKPVSEIYRVDTDTEWSTASAYTTLDYYTTEDYEDYTLIRRIDTGTIGDTETVYVSYSYNDYDDLINRYIPIVEADVISYLNNNFIDKRTGNYGAFSFVARSGSSHPQIKDTGGQAWLKYGMTDCMDIYVNGTPRNDGKYFVTDASSETLKLSSNDTCYEENSTDLYSGVIIYVNRIKWPIELKPIIAKMIWQNIDRIKSGNIKSKSIGPTSITYESLESGGYDKSIYTALKRYKNTYMV